MPPDTRKTSMQKLKNSLFDVYAALVVVVAALTIGGLQIALPYLVS